MGYDIVRDILNIIGPLKLVLFTSPQCPFNLLVINFLAFQPFPKRQFLDSPKLNEFADDNFSFDLNERTSSKPVEKHCGERRNCSL